MGTGDAAPRPCGSGKNRKNSCRGSAPTPPPAGERPGDGRETTSLAGAAIRGCLLDFCGRHLTYEITTRVFTLCDRLDAGGSSRFERGRTEIWAAAIVYAVAQAHRLFDPGDPLGIRPGDIHASFGTRPATVSSKARQIRQLFGMDAGRPGSGTADRAPRRTSRTKARQHGRRKKSSIGDIPGTQMRLFDE